MPTIDRTPITAAEAESLARCYRINPRVTDTWDGAEILAIRRRGHNPAAVTQQDLTICHGLVMDAIGNGKTTPASKQGPRKLASLLDAYADNAAGRTRTFTDEQVVNAYCSRMNDVVLLAYRSPEVIQCRVCEAESEVLNGSACKTRDRLTHKPGCKVGEQYAIIEQHERETGETSAEPFTRKYADNAKPATRQA